MKRGVVCDSACQLQQNLGYAFGSWESDLIDGMNAIGWSFDHAISTFIEDVEARGMQDDILLICCGEMGRTPRINKNGGRDHWARKLAPLLLYGSGFQHGQVIGASDRTGGEPADNPLNPSHQFSTIMNSLFNIGELRLLSGIPPQVLNLGQKPQIVA